MPRDDLNLIVTMESAASHLEGLARQAEARIGSRSPEFLDGDKLALFLLAGRASDIAATLRREIERSSTGGDNEYRRGLLKIAGWIATTLIGTLIAVGVTTDDLDTSWLPGTSINSATESPRRTLGDQVAEWARDFDRQTDDERRSTFLALSVEAQSEAWVTLVYGQRAELSEVVPPSHLLDILSNEQLEELFRTLDWDQRAHLAGGLSMEEAFRFYGLLDVAQQGRLFTVLPRAIRASIFVSLDPERQRSIIDSLDESELETLVTGLNDGDQIESFLSTVHEPQLSRILALLELR